MLKMIDVENLINRDPHYERGDFVAGKGKFQGKRMFKGYAVTGKNNPFPEEKTSHCEECEKPTGYLTRKQVDGFGRTLWLCTARDNNCAKAVRDF